MTINILGKLIDTSSIISINDIESNKKETDPYLNREAGFIVLFKSKLGITWYQSFKENIAADASLIEVKMIKEKWKYLQELVFKKWQEDKSEIEYFGFETKLIHLSGISGVLVKEFSNYYGEAIMIKLDNGREYYAPKGEFRTISN